jgi:hypothetical protein
MHERKNLVERVDRGGWDDDAGLATVRCNDMESPTEMNTSFLVDGDPSSVGCQASVMC